MRLLVLVDSRKYIRREPYQHQLLEALSATHSVRLLSLRELKYSPVVKWPRFDRVISCLKLRTLDSARVLLARRLGETPITIYEQDVWEAFDGGACDGAYDRVLATLNVARFAITSRSWAERLAGVYPAVFVPMGLLPQYCSVGPDWQSRPVDVGFQGTLKPHRITFFSELADMGVKVTARPAVPYREYLDGLQHTQITVFREYGERLWNKALEIAARGTWVVRNWERESEAFDVGAIPTIRLYRDTAEIPGILASIRAMTDEQRNAAMIEAVRIIRDRNDWQRTVEVLTA